MRYSPKQYAAALHDSLRDAHGKEFSDRVKLFLTILKKNNSLKLLPKILKEVERSEQGSVLQISSTHMVSSKITQELKSMLGATQIKEKTTPELLGGAIIEWGDMRLDASVRGKLQQLRTRI